MAAPAAETEVEPRAVPLAPMLAVFFASGVSALIYQMVWQRLLAFFGGADVRSVTIIVASFMAGLGLGSLAGGHVADRLNGRARVMGFAACELAVALFGFASVPLFYDLLYARLGPAGLPVWATAGLVFAALLWPTFFMGASLPLLARALTGAVEQAGRRVAALYGWNTFGAAFGALLAVFVLVRSAGFRAAVEAAAALNLLCALVAVGLGPFYWRRADRPEEARTPGGAAGGASPAAFGFRAWCVLYALSGFIALSLEIVWFRLLGVLLKSNSFTFSTLLALYLTGLGLGALAAGRLARRSRSPGRTFLMLQAAIAPYAAVSVALLVASLGNAGWLERVSAHAAGYDPLPVTAALQGAWQWAVAPQAAAPEARALARLFLDLYVLVPLLLVLPPTFLMGASFPFLQQATQTDLAVLGRRVGWLQVANITGSTLGAVVTGILLLNWIGSSWMLRLLVALSAVFPFLLARQRARPRAVAVAALVFAAAAAVVPSSARLWGKLHGTTPERVIFDEDGSGVSVLREEHADSGRTTVFVSGLGQSGLPYGGYHTVLGALPVLVHPQPVEVAVIGLGSGDTAFAVGARPETRRIDCVEIVACQLPTLRALARQRPYDGLQALLSDPRVRHVAGDGRAFLMRGGGYDVIEADALRPGSAYAGNLYSSEYFRLLRRHLKPGGLAVTWAPTRRTHDTFISVFPHVVAVDDTLLGSDAPIPFDRETVRARTRDGAVKAYFARAGIDIERVLRGPLRRNPRVYGPEYDRSRLAELNTDLFPRDEYLAGETLRPAAGGAP